MVQKIQLVRIVVGMQQKSIDDLERWLVSIRPDIQKTDWMFALEDMKTLLSAIGNPQESYKVVHIAGTSGKTSTAYYTAAMLCETGASVGLTVSPHVDSITERVQINGQPLDDDTFLKLWNEFVQLDPIDAGRITYFGLLVAFALWTFAKLSMDYVVLEVGMGGRLDATNVIDDPEKICVITDIGLDHTQFLGETLAAISSEKSGIIQPHQPVFMMKQSPEVMGVVEARAEKYHSLLHVLSGDIAQAPKQLPAFQKRNWLLAESVVGFLIDRDGLQSPRETQWQKTSTIIVPARMEETQLDDKKIILDGSHNAQKITALTKAIHDRHSGTSIVAILSMVEGKDTSLQESLEALQKVSNHLIVTSFSATQDVYRKAMPCEDIASTAGKAGITQVEIVDDPVQALHRAMQSSEEIILVTGSFFLLNHIRPEIERMRGAA